jgi:Tol biopolymer transport system component
MSEISRRLGHISRSNVRSTMHELDISACREGLQRGIGLARDGARARCRPWGSLLDTQAAEGERLVNLRALACVTLVALPGSAGAQLTLRVSVASKGGELGDRSFRPSISGNGRFVAFVSEAYGLRPRDFNFAADAFVHDRQTGRTSRLCVALDHTSGFPGGTLATSISGDGRYAAFDSRTFDLVPGDTNGASDVFVRDRATGHTSRVSVDSSGVEGNGNSVYPSISPDGRYVAFVSAASNLVPDDTNTTGDVFVHDLSTGVTSRISVSSAGVEGNGNCRSPCLSADGRYVAFASLASSLVPGDDNDAADVFVHDRDADGDGIDDEPDAVATFLVSLGSSGDRGNRSSGFATQSGVSMSADGRFVAFESLASNLTLDDPSTNGDVFLRDRAIGTTVRVSVPSSGVKWFGDSLSPSISADGRHVAFTNSLALVPDQTTQDVFVCDCVTGITTLVSCNAAGVEANGPCHAPSISADGSVVAFDSGASNLVPDTNRVIDVFVRDRRPCAAGGVNALAGPIADVLSVNGSAGGETRIVIANSGPPLELALNASPSGPGAPGLPLARYVVWVWRSWPSGGSDVRIGSRSLGCTVDPTPRSPLLAPHPFVCLRSTDMPDVLVGSVRTLPSPARAPFTVTRPGGFTRVRGFVFTLQGIIEDAGARDPSGFSLTNAVILRIR